MTRSAGVLRTAFLLVLTAVATARADEVKIRVVDGGGTPIPNAKVWISAPKAFEPATVYSTDATGVLTTDVVAAPETRKISGRVTAWAPGWAIGAGMLQAGAIEIRLEKPRSVSGIVNDTAGKPVVGAQVRPVYFRKAGNDYTAMAVVGDTPEWGPLFVKTDAAGRWNMPFVPPSGLMTYGLFDGLYARVNQEVVLTGEAETQAKPLVARPAAAIEGRVIGVDGKPAPAVRVMTFDMNGNSGNDKTDANGHYRLDRLGSGTFTVQQYRREDGYPALPMDAVSVKEGETVHAPDMTLVEGAPVEGTVTAAATGEPLQGAAIVVGQTYASTGRDGRFRVRVLPGKAQVYVMSLPEGYGNPESGAPSSMLNITVPQGGIHDLNFKLPPAQILAGSLVDETGAPPAGITFSVWQKWQRIGAEVGRDGAFRIKALQPGPVGLAVEGDWALVDPPTVTLPRTAPLTVRVRHAVLPTLSGLAVDTGGNPLGGVEVNIVTNQTVSNDGTAGMPGRTDSVVTGADGRYRLAKLRPEQTYSVTAKKAGYRYRTGGTVTANKEILGVSGAMIPNPNPTLSVDNIVLQELSQTLVGIVRDAAGNAVADAEIYAAAGEDTAHTDADGHFRVSRLPPGDVDVFTAKGKLFAKARSKNGTVDDVLLQPVVSAPSMEAGRAMVKELIAGDQSYYAESGIASLARIDPDAALVLVSSLKPDRQARAGAMALLALARADPVKARERIADLLGALPKPLSGYESILLANEMVAYEPHEARAIFDREKALLKPLPADINSDYQALLGRASLGTLGMALKIDGAETLVNETLAAAGKADQNHAYYLDLLMLRIAQGGGALVERATAQLPAERRAGAMARAVGALAKRDLPAARRLLDTIPAMPEPKDGRDPGATPQFAFDSAAIAVIGQLGQTDPAAALVLARRVTTAAYQGKALALAATFQPKAVAIPLLQEALTKNSGGETFRVVVAARAARVDAGFAAELMADDEKRLHEPGAVQSSYDRDQALGQLAYIMAPSQPGRARLILEREAGKEGKKEVWLRLPGLLAMARIDFGRAVELANVFAARDDGNEQGWTRQFLLSTLAQYALTPEPARSSASLARLINGNNEYWNEADD